MTSAIGIDLGTTFSCVAHYKNGRARVISNNNSKRMTPSRVVFSKTERLVGEDESSEEAILPNNIIFSVKRLIGRRYSDPEVADVITKFPFKVIDKDGVPIIEVERNTEKMHFRPEEISAMVLEKMKEVAKNSLEEDTKDAVITVPAYFNDAQRQATKDAAKIAGINTLRIISEPTAAAVAYVVENRVMDKRNILVFDLGGGTFDVSIMTVNAVNCHGICKVIATGGDTHLGGDDFDACLLNHFAKEFKSKHGVDVLNDRKAVTRLLAECRRVKIRLSNTTFAKWDIVQLHGELDYASEITRARYEDLCDHLFKRTMERVRLVLSDSKLSKNEIDDVVLVGGSSRMAKIFQNLSEFFGREKIRKSIDPDEIVALGAAIQAMLLSSNPPEELKHLKLSDVTPLTLGIEDFQKKMANIVPRNTPIPLAITKKFSTSYDYQTVLTFPVYQGENPNARDNILLGSFELSGLPPALCGAVSVEVTFNIDEDNILQATAVHEQSGIRKDAVITQNNRLPRQNIERIIAESGQYRTEYETSEARMVTKDSFENFAFFALGKFRNHEFPVVGEEADIARARIESIVQWAIDYPDVTQDQYITKTREIENVIDLMTALSLP